MKFEYNTEDKECVAFIHQSGRLIIRMNENGYSQNYCQVVNSDSFGDKEWWNTWLKMATKRFYKGDKITITF